MQLIPDCCDVKLCPVDSFLPFVQLLILIRAVRSQRLKSYEVFADATKWCYHKGKQNIPKMLRIEPDNAPLTKLDWNE